MSKIHPRDINMLLHELSRVNQLQGPAVFDHTEGFITWVLGKGWDFDQKKYDAVVRYWYQKTSDGALTDQTRAKYLINLLLEDEDDVFYDKIFESMLHSDSTKFSSMMQFYWKIRDEKAWDKLTLYEKASECRKKWNSSDDISKADKLILFLSNHGCSSMFRAMISSPIIVDCMYKKWVESDPKLPAYERQIPGQTRRK
jgi:hypothetical protein